MRSASLRDTDCAVAGWARAVKQSSHANREHTDIDLIGAGFLQPSISNGDQHQVDRIADVYTPKFGREHP